MKIETFARLQAALDRGEDSSTALTRAGLTPPRWETAQREVALSISDQCARGDESSLEVYLSAYRDGWEEPEELPEPPVREAAIDLDHTARFVAPLLVAHEAARLEPAGPPPNVQTEELEESPMVDPLDTTAFMGPGAPLGAWPFQPGPPGESVPMTKQAPARETTFLDDARRATVLGESGFVGRAPTLPFGGSSPSGESAKGPQRGATVAAVGATGPALPSGWSAASTAEVDLSMLPLSRYAELSLALAETTDRAATLRKFVLTEDAWKNVTSAWATKIREDPALKAEFDAEIARLRASRR